MATKTKYRRKLTKGERGAPKVGPPLKSDRGRVRTNPQASAAEQDHFGDIMVGEAREANARAILAEDKASAHRARNAKITREGGGTGTHVSDTGPPGSRTASMVKAPRRAGSSTRNIARTLRRFGGGNPRRVLIAEVVAVLAIITVSAIAEGEAPKPSQYVAPFAVYLVLAFLTEFGEDSARLAAGMGALVLLVLMLNHAGGLVTVLTYLTGDATGGPPKKHPTHGGGD